MEWDESFGAMPERAKMEQVGSWGENPMERLFRLNFSTVPPENATHILVKETSYRDEDIHRELYTLGKEEAREWLKKREVCKNEDELGWALRGI